MSGWFTVVPPLLAILMVVLTRKVLLSLGVGILAAALVATRFDVIESGRLIWEAFAGIFWADGALNTTNVFILIFTLMLGVIAAFIMMSGGTQAFADWAMTRIRGRRPAQGLAGGLGIAIFIDDYFNALAVGRVCQPVTDRNQVSRAKLAYLIDSTSAPVAVLTPVSSWGAYIVGLLAPIVAAAGLNTSDILAFIEAAASNYYAIAAVLTVFLIIFLKIDFGPMRKQEHQAIEAGRPFDEGADIPGELSEDLPIYHPGARRALIVPFAVLLVGVIGSMMFTGWREGGSADLLSMFENTLVPHSLVMGGALGLATAIYYYFRYTNESPKFGINTFFRGWQEGIGSMLPAVTILTLAWMLGSVIDALGTGPFLGELVENSGMAPGWLVPVMFVAAAGMAFSTGTSWGSFGILIPVAGTIMVSVNEPSLLLPAMGAVLAGAVMGDHCSPISDTTILSATGAGCEVVTHVTTQLPYALFAGLAALIGYVAVALGFGPWIGLLVMVVVLVGGLFGIRIMAPPLPEPAIASASETPGESTAGA